MVTRRYPRSDAMPIRRLFAIYAAVSLLPVLALGAVLMGLIHRQATDQGLAEARGKATLLAATTVAPALANHALTGAKLSPAQAAAIATGAAASKRNGGVLRMRIRGLDGTVVWSDDGSGYGTPPDDEALDASSGHSVVHVTDLNADADDEVSSAPDSAPDSKADGKPGGDAGAAGPRVAEAYVPIFSANASRQLGVLEVYLPYAPIAADVDHGEKLVAGTLAVGLSLLWLALLGVSVSVTRRMRRAAATNAHLATHDSLTGLANRARFEQLVARRAGEAVTGEPTAIAVLDLDRFKQVNDTLGHANGDLLLSRLAARIDGGLRETDTLARLGGDEFAIILDTVHGPIETAEILERIRSVISEPIVIDQLPLTVEASVGFVLIPDDGTDVDTLLTRAEMAMYVAKERHLGVAHFQPDHNRHDAATLGLVAELAGAIEAGELTLHYQPKTDVRTGTITAIEALVRWQHPVHGLLFPDAFIPAAEQTELIEPLTHWVLERALAELPSFDPAGTLSVAVNVSARSLARDEFACEVLTILERSGIAPSRLIIEITETALVTDTHRADLNLTRLHREGVRVSIDDFGAGQTSLAYLASLPIAELKIDKGFVMAMTGDARNAAIVRSVIELGHSLGFTVTAEGVETDEILGDLAAADCDLAQGYLLSRPLTADRLREHLSARRLLTAHTVHSA